MSEELSVIPINPYKLMKKYLKLLKSDYVNERMVIALLEFIAEQDLLDEADAFIKEKLSICQEEVQRA